VEIELDRVPLQPGDGLLLCSDGLWGYVADDNIAMVATDPNLSVQTIADTLLLQALNAGGLDNIGIEFIRVDGATPAGATPVPAVAASAAAAGLQSVPQAPSSAAPGSHTQRLVALGLLVFAGCGSLGYLAYANHSHAWPFHTGQAKNDGAVLTVGGDSNDGDSSHKGDAGKSGKSDKPKTDNPGNKPPQDKKILVVGEVPPESPNNPQDGNFHWKRAQITKASSHECEKHGGEKPVVFAHTQKELDEMVKQHPELGGSLQPGAAEIRIQAKFPKGCEAFDAVVIMPKNKPAATENEASHPATPPATTPAATQPPTVDPPPQGLP
jgi:hypothetical protein